MNHYLYLMVDLGCIALPFAFSFYPKINFYKEWKWFLPANFIIAILFLIWDEYFTKMGVWGFNPDYVTGYYVGDLPIEEILFFICIPYACTFTYFVLKKFDKAFFTIKTSKVALIAFFILALILLIIGYPRYYTTVTMALCLLFLPILYVDFQRNNIYLLSMYFLILVPFLISNGILTGSFVQEPVVWYNNDENLNFRVFTIPVEDFFYGFLLLSLNVYVYEKFKIFYN